MCLQTAWLPKISLKIAHSLTVMPMAAWNSVSQDLSPFGHISFCSSCFVCFYLASYPDKLPSGTSWPEETGSRWKHPLGCCHEAQATLKDSKSPRLLPHFACLVAVVRSPQFKGWSRSLIEPDSRLFIQHLKMKEMYMNIRQGFVRTWM